MRGISNLSMVAEQLEVAWPPDITAVLAERAQRLMRLRNSPKAMESAMVYYKTHWADFINDWMMTYDPRVDGNPQESPYPKNLN